MKCNKCHLPFKEGEKRVARGEKTFHEWCDRFWRYDLYHRLQELLAKSEGRTLPVPARPKPNIYTDPFIRKWQDGDDAA